MNYISVRTFSIHIIVDHELANQHDEGGNNTNEQISTYAIQFRMKSSILIRGQI